MSRKQIDSPIRTQIISIVEGAEMSLSLSSITENVNLTKGAIQQHLYFLEKIGIVAHFKIGKNYYYYLKERVVTEIQKQELIYNTVRFYGL